MNHRDTIGFKSHGRTNPRKIPRTSATTAGAALEALEGRTMLAVQPLEIGQFKGRPGQFGAVNGATLFTTTDFPNGQLLWATDGTAAGTRLVKDLDASPSTGAAWFMGGRDNALTVGDTFYFTGVDNAHGRELWRSDGTPEGTRLVADVTPGMGDSDPKGFVALGNQLIFSANGQLWRSDGTTAGTVMIKDADPLGSSGAERMAARGGFVYFMTYPAADPYVSEHHTGQLWRTDGTARGTVVVRDVSPQPFDPTGASSTPSQLINVGGTLYFTANDGENGFELFRSDGTKRGTVLVRDLMTGGATPFLDGSYPTNLTDVNGTLFFSAASSLWKTNGTRAGTVKLRDVTQPRGFTNVNGQLFFVSGENLWVSDGTRPGTRMVAPGQVGETFGPGGVGALNGRLYFGADGGSGFELYESDGTLARTALAFEAEPGPASSHPKALGRVGDKVVFTARGESTALWQTYALQVPAPHAPRGLRLLGESDSGTSADDRTTHVRRPTITGSAPADSLVRLFAGETEIGSTIARGGTFQILPNIELPDGTHALTATARDDLGRGSEASAALDVTIDTVGATVGFKAVSPQKLELTFSEDVGASLAADDLTLLNLTTGQPYPPGAIAVSYDAGTRVATLTFPSTPTGLTPAEYRLTVAADGVTDAAGNPLPQPASFAFAPPAGPLVGVARGNLRILGTHGDDSIVVRLSSGDPNVIEVGINGSFTSHAAADVSMIRIDAGDGNDDVRFDQSNGALRIRSTTYAGDGNDTFTGGLGRDRVYAGNGDDVVYGGGGHDILYGEAGDDQLFGERGNDYLVGGPGRDVMRGNFGSDRLILENGIDEVMLDRDDRIVNDVG